ncbi:MAG: ribonuclease P protein subunit [Candidatus Nanoarchaeia archaeon]
MADKTQSFIGKEAHVVQGNPSMIGLRGCIVEDTKNTFVLEVAGVTKTVLKKGTVFIINNQKVFGDDVAKRLTDRIKLRR